MNAAQPTTLARSILEATSVDVARCYQCGKCTAGCPMARFMDLMPHQVMRLVQIGNAAAEEKLLACAALWSCAGCLTCTQRCPKELDPAAVMDVLREMFLRAGQGLSGAEEGAGVPPAFLKTVESGGRMSEFSLVRRYKMASRDFMSDVALGAGDVGPGKVEIRRAQDAGRKEVRQDLRGVPQGRRPMKSIGYYPGCALAGSGIELDLSIRALSRLAGVELREIDDWNCCGASAAHSISLDLAVALPYRILALAEAQGLTEVLGPCASCFSRLKGTSSAWPEPRTAREDAGAHRAARAIAPSRCVNVLEFVNRLLEDGLAGETDRAAKAAQGRRLLWLPAQPGRGHRRGRRRREPHRDGSRHPRRRMRGRSLELRHGMLRRRLQHVEDRGGGGAFRGDPGRRRGGRRADAS